MQARPVKMHYCESCGCTHEGKPEELGNTLRIGCCFDLNWSGTRDQAADLYDYLVNSGYLNEDYRECADGCVTDEIYDKEGWKCGSCGETFSEDDYNDPKRRAVECCGGSYNEPEQAPKITIDMLLRGTAA